MVLVGFKDLLRRQAIAVIDHPEILVNTVTSEHANLSSSRNTCLDDKSLIQLIGVGCIDKPPEVVEGMLPPGLGRLSVYRDREASVGGTLEHERVVGHSKLESHGGQPSEV